MKESLLLRMDFRYCVYNCDVLQKLVPFVQFKKREKHPKQHSTMGVFHVYKIVQMVPTQAKYLTRNRYSYWVTQIQIFFYFMSKLGFHDLKELSCSNLNCDRKKPSVNWCKCKTTASPHHRTTTSWWFLSLVILNKLKIDVV